MSLYKVNVDVTATNTYGNYMWLLYWLYAYDTFTYKPKYGKYVYVINGNVYNNKWFVLFKKHIHEIYTRVSNWYYGKYK